MLGGTLGRLCRRESSAWNPGVMAGDSATVLAEASLKMEAMNSGTQRGGVEGWEEPNPC